MPQFDEQFDVEQEYYNQVEDEKIAYLDSLLTIEEVFGNDDE